MKVHPSNFWMHFYQHQTLHLHFFRNGFLNGKIEICRVLFASTPHIERGGREILKIIVAQLSFQSLGYQD